MIRTRLTDRFDLKHPVVCSPMALATGGRLAAAVSQAGGLGIIGGAYGDPDWLAAEFAVARNAAVGCGFITWKLAEHPQRLTEALAHGPRVLFLSFGDPGAYAREIQNANVPLMAQVQSLKDAKAAAECGAGVIVAQGAEAGGHGEVRGTMSFVPEVADWLANHHPEVLLLAAGGIADGRGLAAALMLGADGVLLGSRFWASEESLAHPNMVQAALAATGDDTIRTTVMDIARRLNWSSRYTARVLKNAFTTRWHEDLAGLIEVAEVEALGWTTAWQAGDIEGANTFVGEATGLISEVKPAADILSEIVTQAETLLGPNSPWTQTNV